MSEPLPPNVRAALDVSNKIEAIRLLRVHTGLGLYDAKKAVESGSMPSKPLARPMITWESAASSSYSCGASSGFFYQHVACCDHELVDLVEQLRGEQADVVFEGLEVIADIIKGTMKVHVLTG